MGREAKEEVDGCLNVLRRVFLVQLLIQRLWLVSWIWRVLVYSPGLFLLLARVGSSFLWRYQLSLPRPPMVDWKVFFGVESTAIASRLSLGQMDIRAGFRSGLVCFVFRAAPMFCSYIIQRLTISSDQSSSFTFKCSTCVLCPPICQSKVPGSKVWPSNFDISDLPLTRAFEKSQLAMKILYRV